MTANVFVVSYPYGLRRRSYMPRRTRPPAPPEAPNPYRTPEFLELQRKWDAKLAESGFVDIEPLNDNGSRNTPYLKDHSIRFYNRYKPVQADYYRLAGQFAEDRTSPIACALTPTQRGLWRMHADGVDMHTMVQRMETDPALRRELQLTRVPQYWALKKLLAAIRKQFRVWCVEETTRDQLDTHHQADGGLDAWLEAHAGTSSEDEDPDA